MKNTVLRLALTGLLALALASLALGGADSQPASPASGPASRPSAETTQPADPQAQTQFQLLETIGAVSGASLYQAYLTIGLLADAKEEGVYELKDAQGILATLDTLLAANTRKLQALGKLDTVGKNDRQTLSRLGDLHALLARQGRELQAYWKSGNPKDAEKYEATRKEAWKGISALLGVEE